MAATGSIPMPTDAVTIERLKAVLLGIATQIASGIAEAKSEMTGIITEAQLRWQAMLAEQAEGQVPGAVPSGLADLRDDLVQNKASADDTFREQNAEMRQQQQISTEVETQARRATATMTDLVQDAERTTADLARDRNVFQATP